MNRKQYECYLNTIPDFEKKYVKRVSVFDIRKYHKSQARAVGHNFHKIKTLGDEIEQYGQLVPITVTKNISSGTYDCQDGHTRLFYFLRKIQELANKTGLDEKALAEREENKILVSDYIDLEIAMDSTDWKKYRFNMNEHEFSSSNGKKDFEKHIGELFEDGCFTKEIGYSFRSNPDGFKKQMEKIIKRDYPKWQRETTKIVKKILTDPGKFSNFWAYDAPSATEKMRKISCLNWSESKSGKTDEKTNVAAWSCGTISQISKDQLAYSFKRKTQEPKTETVLICYINSGNLAGRDRKYIFDQRERFLKEINKWNNLKNSLINYPLWDRIGFLPQVKSEEQEDKIIWATIDNNGNFKIK